MTLFKRHLVFGAFGAGLALLNREALRALFDLSRNNASSSHLVLIPIITLGLIYLNRATVFSSVRAGVAPGLAILAAGIGLSIAGMLYRPTGVHDDSLALALAAFVVCAIGGFVLLYGVDAFRAARFPLLFLGFMIPMPGILLDGATRFLKTGSAEAVAGLFTLTGTPYYREGFVFSMPEFAIEVADECSGIRSSIALLLTSLLAGHMFLEKSWTRTLLAAAILPIVILKNGVRIASLSLLAMHVDPGFLTGQLHHEGGVVFFLLGLTILGPVLFMLRRAETSGASGISADISQDKRARIVSA